MSDSKRPKTRHSREVFHPVTPTEKKIAAEIKKYYEDKKRNSEMNHE
ncbi:MAG: hypothetical protein ABSE73_27925 [Planctomycetota bacterium]